MKQSKTRILAFMLVVVLCMSLFCMTAYAEPDDETAPTETVTEETVTPVEIETPIETEPVVPTEPETEPTAEAPAEPEPVSETEPTPDEQDTERSMFRFTPDGSLTLIDDFEYVGMDENGNVLSKQFITVQDRSGKYFFIIIDRTGNTENVYFLNQVDLSDLKTLASSNQQDTLTASCTCTSKCTVGHIDTSCPVCSVNMSECAVSEVSPSQADPDTPETTEPESPSGQTEKAPFNPVLVIVLVAAMAGILIFYVVKFKKNKVSGKPAPEFDDDDEYETEPDDDESDEK